VKIQGDTDGVFAHNTLVTGSEVVLDCANNPAFIVDRSIVAGGTAGPLKDCNTLQQTLVFGDVVSLGLDAEFRPQQQSIVLEAATADPGGVTDAVELNVDFDGEDRLNTPGSPREPGADEVDFGLCGGTGGNCSVCNGGEQCDRDCSFNGCTEVCLPGSDCAIDSAIDFSGSTTFKMRCIGGTCDFNCSSADDSLCELICAEGATCTMNCNNVASCQLACDETSTCIQTCTSDADICDMQCTSVSVVSGDDETCTPPPA
jgi:hypothetical protein